MLQLNASIFSNVLEVCYKCFILMLQKYIEILHMLKKYVPNFSSVFSLMLQQVFPCCKLQVFHVDVAYVAVLYTYVACVLFQMF